MIRQKKYQLVFRPETQRYPGPDGAELVHDRIYPHWVVNDHCHICDENGSWHLFGITHPKTSCNHTHEGEVQLFHAASSSPLAMYRDLGTILPPSERPGERKEIHAPTVIRHKSAYYMLYGPEQMRLARSADLMQWELLGTVFENHASARDPQLLRDEKGFLAVFCMGSEVVCRRSSDLFCWSKPQTLLRFAPHLNPESPFLYRRNNGWYLFVCLFDGVNDLHTLPGSYQMITQVYHTAELREFSSKDFCCTLRAHAPEILDYQGKTYLTSAFYPEDGIQIAELEFLE